MISNKVVYIYTYTTLFINNKKGVERIGYIKKINNIRHGPRASKTIRQ